MKTDIIYIYIYINDLALSGVTLQDKQKTL